MPGAPPNPAVATKITSRSATGVFSDSIYFPINNSKNKLLTWIITLFSKTFGKEGGEYPCVQSKIHSTLLKLIHSTNKGRVPFLAPCSRSRLEAAPPGAKKKKRCFKRARWVPCPVRRAHPPAGNTHAWNPSSHVSGHLTHRTQGVWVLRANQGAGPPFHSSCSGNTFYQINEYTHWHPFQADFLYHRKSSVTVANSTWILSARWELREVKLIKIVAFDIRVDRERVSVSGSKGNKQA